MTRIVVIDKTVIDQIHSGNGDMARAVRALHLANVEIWMTRETYKQLHTDAEQRVISEIGIRFAMVGGDVDPERYEKRLNPGPHATDAVPHRSTATAALALDKGAELLTADKVFADTFRKVGGKIAAEGAGIASVQLVKKSDLNYNVGRRLLGLRDLNIRGDGRILPAAKPAGGGSASKPAAPPPSKPAAPPPKGGPRTTAHVGDKLTAPEEHGPSASADAKLQGAELGLKGLNFIVHQINDHVQAKRVKEKWSRMKPEVEKRLDADPEMGALVVVSYSQGRGDKESPLTPTAVFDDIRVGYGLTEEDAKRRLRDQAYIGPVSPYASQGSMSGQRYLWHPPKQPVDVRKLPTPFAAAGLATFVPGKEKVTRVKFSIAFGFDDKMSSRQTLKVPSDVGPRFLYLWPPSEVTYFDSTSKKADVEWGFSRAADTSKADLGMNYVGVPVVKLDSWMNPYSTTAAMVWPADNATANLFKKTSPTDHGGVFRNMDLSLLRWVKPEFIRVLEDFGPNQAPSPEDIAWP